MSTAVCAIVRNEQSSILQWIVYHCLLGFDTVLLLDDLSTDLTAVLARQAAAIYDVRVFPFKDAGNTRQADAYLRICREHRAEFDHIAFIDADEYLVPRNGDTLAGLLSRCAGHAGIAVPWLMFGSSHHVTKPNGLVIEDFQHRSPFAFPPNRHVKSIVRPEAVTEAVNPHVFGMDGFYCLPDGSRGDWEGPGVLQSYPHDSPWMLHHYFTRSRAHWSERMSRGQLGQFVRTWSDFECYDRNEVHDGTAAAFSLQVRRRVAEMNRHHAVPGAPARPRVQPARFEDLARLRHDLIRIAASEGTAAMA